jgi:UDP-N-acetylmuramoyl-L-alanyl-D-glutamate--2,6-diaminopimelate ligase
MTDGLGAAGGDASAGGGTPPLTQSLAGLVRWLGERGLLASAGSSAAAGPSAPVQSDVELTGVTDDSRAVQPGQLFVAVPGLTVDGHDFAAEAVAAGAAALLVERPTGQAAVPEILVRQASAALASAAAWWYGDPSRELTVVGVTGTNGKTTTTFLAAAALRAAGWPAGIVGTIGITVGGDMHPNRVANTTPAAPELQRLLRSMVRAGDQAAVIEASSHGLATERVGSVAFDAAIFTNLSHEHLDFHGTLEAYRAAKLSLFERLPATAKDGRAGLGIANLDDPQGPAFLAAARATGARGIGYGRARGAEVRLVDVAADASSCRIEAEVAGRPVSLALRIGGRYNAHNALAALGLGAGWELDLDRVVAGLEAVPGIPGRLESIDRGQPFHVIVDFAHTPGSLDAVTQELSELAAPSGGRVLSVFGASGQRDLGKRPLMGEAAGRWSELVIVTEDDSRDEDPVGIYEAVAKGAEAAGRRRGDDLLVIPDRREAIAQAYARARPGDIVLVAGKGHETSNIGPSGPEPWSDRAVAEEELAKLGFSGTD